MASDDDINIMMHVVGNFKGLDALIRNKEITQEDAGNLRAYAFKRIGVRVAEIRTEVAKLQGVVQTLETVCLQGAHPKPAAAEGEITRLRQAVTQLHGWTVSLAESDYELIARVEDPTVAGRKFHELAGQLSSLRLERQVTRQHVTGKGRISI